MNMDFLKQYIASRYHMLLAIIALYLAPLLLLLFSRHIVGGWYVASLGMLLMLSGGMALFLLMDRWERELETSYSDQHGPLPCYVEAAAFEEALAQSRHMEASMALLEQEKSSLEQQLADRKNDLQAVIKDKERAHRQLEQTTHEFHAFKEATDEKLEQNNLFLGEYRQTIHEQRSALENKQQQIEQLDAKVRDLTYEIKTLLQLAEKSTTALTLSLNKPVETSQRLDEESPSRSLSAVAPINSDADARQELKCCIEVAQKITAASHTAAGSLRNRDLPVDNYALDFRRLCDGLHDECSHAMLVYSQKDEKLIFVNQQVQELLGWTKEKFTQNFHGDILVTPDEWRQLLAQLTYKNECYGQLQMKAKNGQQIPVDCHVGIIPTGIFRSNIIAVLESE
jgi:PAS domain S-box-containing protein